MPPQGLLVIAAYLPKEWEIPFCMDENLRPAAAADYSGGRTRSSSAGCTSSVGYINAINDRAQPSSGRMTVLGGPSVSSSPPECYPEVDVLHVGELGDAMDALIARRNAKRGVACAAGGPKHHERATAPDRFPPAGLRRLWRSPATSLASVQFFERLSLPLRVL